MKFRWETEFKETEIGEIPRDWEVNNLRYVLKSLETGNRPKGGKIVHNPNGILSIGGENISWDGNLVLENCLRFDENFYNSLKHGKIESGDVLLVKDGATIGKLAYIKKIPEDKAMVNEHVFLLKTDPDKYNSRFLYYFLKSEIGQTQIEGSISGSAQGGINRSILDTILIPNTDITEQTRIATVLSYFDDLIEVKKKQNEILEKTAMAIFKSWFIDFEPFKDGEFVDSELGRIPKGWEVKRLDHLCTFIKGKKCKIDEIPTDKHYPYLLIETFKTGEIKYWTTEKEPLINEMDICIVADGESSGKILRYQQGVLGSTLLTLKVQKESLKNYIYLALKFLEEEIMEHRTGSAIPHLDKDFLKSIEIILPNEKISNSFHSLVEPLFQKIILNQKQIMTLKKIRDTLLPLLVFGKLRVKEI